MSRVIEGLLNEKNQFIIDILVSQDTLNNLSEAYLKKHIFKGLIDTGASNSTISSHVVNQLNLIPSGKNNMISATEVKKTNIYHVHMVILKTQIVGAVLDNKNNISAINNVNTKRFDVVACELPKYDNDFDILIGIDILRGCLLVVDRERFFYLSKDFYYY